MLHGTEFLQIQWFTFEQPEEVFYHSIVQTVSFSAHTLPDALFAEHSLVLPVPVLPAEDGREIELFSEQTELRHIRNPLLVRLFGMEIPIQQIWYDFAYFSLVRTILLHPDTANQAQLLHKPLDSLVVQREFTLAKFCRNPAIAVSSFVFVVDGCDLRFDSFILICTVHPFQMVVESGTG